jgi:hypothetical protein
VARVRRGEGRERKFLDDLVGVLSGGLFVLFQLEAMEGRAMHCYYFSCYAINLKPNPNRHWFLDIAAPTHQLSRHVVYIHVYIHVDIHTRALNHTGRCFYPGRRRLFPARGSSSWC